MRRDRVETGCTAVHPYNSVAAEALSARQIGQAPEVAPFVVGGGGAGLGFGVAVDPSGLPAEFLSGSDVVFGPKGDVKHLPWVVANAFQRLLEDDVRGFVGTAVLGRDDVVEWNADVLERVGDDVAIAVRD